MDGGGQASFLVTLDPGYSTNRSVAGNCPGGSWSGETYTTGAISQQCTVESGFSEFSSPTRFEEIIEGATFLLFDQYGHCPLPGTPPPGQHSGTDPKRTPHPQSHPERVWPQNLIRQEQEPLGSR